MTAALILFLAQSCVAEIDFPPKPDECFVMWHLNARKVGYDPAKLEHQIRRYNSVWKRKRDGSYLLNTGRVLWVRALGAGDEQPEHWPTKSKWEKSRPRWGRIVAAAEKMLGQTRADHPCPKARHYGGPIIDAVPSHWITVKCLKRDQRQAYYRIREIKEGTSRTVPADLAAGRRMKRRHRPAP